MRLLRLRGFAALVMAWTMAACSAAPSYEERYPSGRLRASGALTLDTPPLRTGHWVFWYESGQKQAEGYYVKGRSDGRVDELGVPVDGQRGVWSGWFESGAKAFEYTLDAEGRHIGTSTRWYPNGVRASEATPPDRYGHFVVRQWYRNGAKHLESQQDQDGNLDGVEIEWQLDGSVLRQQHYRQGKKL